MSFREPKAHTGPRFNRNAQLVLAVALGLVLLSTIQVIYRFTLPTDGWSVYFSDLEQPDWIYDRNLTGTPSPLQQDDTLLAVDGQSMRGLATNISSSPPANWIAGRSVQMTVLREGRELSFAVPVVRWTLAAWWRYNISDIDRLVDFLGALTLFAIGLFTFLKRPAVPSAYALLILSAAFFSSSISGSLPDGLSVQFDPPAFFAVSFFSYAIFGTLLAPSLLTFTLLFPRPKQIIQRHPWLALLPYGLGLVILAALIAGAAAAVGWFGTMGMILASIASLVHSGFTQRDAVSRAQLRWAVGGFVFGLALALMTFPVAFGWVTNPVLGRLMGLGVSIGFTVVGISLAIAVLRYRLYDIDVIIRKTLVYAVLSALLALVYLGSVVLLQQLFEGLSGQQSPVAIVVSTLLIAALFTPLRRRVQDFIDRRFYRQRYDAQKVLVAFSQTARDEVELEALTAELLRVVEETMRPEQVSLWLKFEDKKG